MSSRLILLKFALRSPILIVMTIILGFSGAIFNGVSTASIIPLLLAFIGEENTLFKAGPPMIEKFMSWYDGFTGDGRLFAMFVTVLLAIILKNGAGVANTLVSGHLSRSLINNMRLEGLQLLLDVDIDFYSKNKSGEILNKMNPEVYRTTQAITIALKMISSTITISIFTYVLISISWQLTIMAVVFISGVAWGNQYFVKRSQKYGIFLSEQSKYYSNKLLETLTGIRLIKTVSNEGREYKIINNLIRAREQANFNLQINYALLAPVNEVAGILAIFGMVLAILLIYLIFLFRLLPIVSQLNNNLSQFASVSHSAQIITEFLRREDKPIMTNGNIPYTKLKEGIRFVNVSFAYPGKEDLVLKDIDLWIPKGKTIALVGASGAGKSTIADLLPRFYDPVAGKILVDGEDLKAYELHSFRHAIGVVSQDTFLFNNTLSYNIAYGREDVREEEIIEAAKKANAYEFITQLPEGFDT